MMGYSISALIWALNFVLAKLNVKLTDYEKHRTKTDYNISLASKTAFSLFFNNGLQTFLIKVMVPWFHTNLE